MPDALPDMEAQNFESERVDRLVTAARFAMVYHDEPCRADHHGLCQTHNLEPLEYCWVKDLREALAAFKREKND